MNDKRLKGAMGETLAAAYYRKKGFEILAANYRTRQGEIDLIVQKQNLIIFCEVKTRSGNSIAAAKEFVTASKQKRIILAAQAYISTNNLTDNDFRFDVVEIYIDKNSKETLNCIENAFNL